MSVMATPSPHITPQSAPPSAAGPDRTPSPGSWRHPRFDEIARRQRANTFNDSNVRRIAYNGVAAVVLAYAYNHPTTSTLFTEPSLSTVSNAVLCTIVALLLYNILVAVLPLIRTPDKMADIALTPTQRALLGLDPSATPPLTPGSRYITPPRYQRSVTPRSMSGSASISRSASGTPLSRKESPSAVITDHGDSPTHSPLWQKTREVARRGSSSRSSPLGLGAAPERPKITSTFSSGSGKGAVGLNSKWLYERGRRSSGLYP